MNEKLQRKESQRRMYDIQTKESKMPPAVPHSAHHPVGVDLLFSFT